MPKQPKTSETAGSVSFACERAGELGSQSDVERESDAASLSTLLAASIRQTTLPESSSPSLVCEY